jgi:hypothetical protein
MQSEINDNFVNIIDTNSVLINDNNNGINHEENGVSFNNNEDNNKDFEEEVKHFESINTMNNELKQLINENKRLRQELAKANRMKINKNSRISQLKNNNQILKNELLMANKLIDILFKFKTFYEQNDDLKQQEINEKIIKSNDLLVENEDKDIYKRSDDLNKLQNDYLKIMSEKNENQLLINESKRSKGKLRLPKISNKDLRLESNSRINYRINKKNENSNVNYIENNENEDKEDYQRSKKLKPQFRCHWPGCGYETNRTLRLNEHMNASHTGERPFKCHIQSCDKVLLNLIILY